MARVGEVEKSSRGRYALPGHNGHKCHNGADAASLHGREDTENKVVSVNFGQPQKVQDIVTDTEAAGHKCHNRVEAQTGAGAPKDDTVGDRGNGAEHWGIAPLDGAAAGVGLPGIVTDVTGSREGGHKCHNDSPTHKTNGHKGLEEVAFPIVTDVTDVTDVTGPHTDGTEHAVGDGDKSFRDQPEAPNPPRWRGRI